MRDTKCIVSTMPTYNSSYGLTIFDFCRMLDFRELIVRVNFQLVSLIIHNNNLSMLDPPIALVTHCLTTSQDINVHLNTYKGTF